MKHSARGPDVGRRIRPSLPPHLDARPETELGLVVGSRDPSVNVTASCVELFFLFSFHHEFRNLLHDFLQLSVASAATGIAADVGLGNEESWMMSVLIAPRFLASSSN